MEEEFGFKLSDDDLQELKELSELGEMLIEEGEAKGEARGIAKLMKMARFIKSKLLVGLSLDEAMVLPDVPQKDYAKYKNFFSEMFNVT